MNVKIGSGNQQVTLKSTFGKTGYDAVHSKSEAGETCLDIMRVDGTQQHVEIYGPAAGRQEAAEQLLKNLPAGASVLETADGGTGTLWGKGSQAHAFGPGADAQVFGDGSTATARNEASGGKANAGVTGSHSQSLATNLSPNGSATSHADGCEMYILASTGPGEGSRSFADSFAKGSHTEATTTGERADLSVANFIQSNVNASAGAGERVHLDTGHGTTTHPASLSLSPIPASSNKDHGVSSYPADFASALGGAVGTVGLISPDWLMEDRLTHDKLSLAGPEGAFHTWVGPDDGMLHRKSLLDIVGHEQSKPVSEYLGAPLTQFHSESGALPEGWVDPFYGPKFTGTGFEFFGAPQGPASQDILTHEAGSSWFKPHLDDGRSW